MRLESVWWHCAMAHPGEAHAMARAPFRRNCAYCATPGSPSDRLGRDESSRHSTYQSIDAICSRRLRCESATIAVSDGSRGLDRTRRRSSIGVSLSSDPRSCCAPDCPRLRISPCQACVAVCFSASQERQQIGVELILVRCREAVRCTRIDLQRRVRHELRRE
jgi:hypothetical protein